jgi:hypothetical protein
MKPIFKSISYLALVLTVAAPLLVWAGQISIETNKNLLILGMILWFSSAVFWIKHDPSANA